MNKRGGINKITDAKLRVSVEVSDFVMHICQQANRRLEMLVCSKERKECRRTAKVERGRWTNR